MRQSCASSGRRVMAGLCPLSAPHLLPIGHLCKQGVVPVAKDDGALKPGVALLQEPPDLQQQRGGEGAAHVTASETGGVGSRPGRAKAAPCHGASEPCTLVPA